MKQIKLSNCDEFALVDDEVFDELINFTWRKNAQGYAVRREYTRISKGTRHARDVRMHRQIMGEPEGLEVDHINGDTLDNRRSELRLATHQFNLANRPKQKNNKSGYKGVSWNKNAKKWQATIQVKGKSIGLGYFIDIKDAAKAYDIAAIKYFGEFARLNKI